MINDMRKLLRFPLVRLGLGILVVVVPYFIVMTKILHRILALFSHESTLFLVRTLAYLGITAFMVGLYGVYVRWFEQRPLTEFAPHAAGLAIRDGILGSLLFAGFVFIPLGLNGNLTIAAVNGWAYVPQGMALAVMAATAEEIMFRGLLFRLLEEKLGSVWAVVISSFLFGLSHYVNPGVTAWRALPVGLEAGLTLPALFMLTRNLWLCISAHATWNALNYLLGIPEASGPTKGYFTSALTGTDLLTGGAFGLEFSLLTSGLASVLGVWLFWIAYRRDTVLQYTL